MKQLWQHIKNQQEWYVGAVLAFLSIKYGPYVELFCTGKWPLDLGSSISGTLENFKSILLIFAVTGWAKGRLIPDFPNDVKVPWSLHLIESITTLVFFFGLLYAIRN